MKVSSESLEVLHTHTHTLYLEEKTKELLRHF